MSSSIPVVLFVYARPDLLRCTLASLEANQIPQLYVFSDAPRNSSVAPAVEEVRRIVEDIDWCDIHCEKNSVNLGLGKSILRGVGSVLERHDAAIIFEDDIVCAPHTYKYISAALDHYAHDDQVMSVAGWTHPKIRPPVSADQPFFSGRFACWGWGTWRRAWKGMDVRAATLLTRCRLRCRDVYRYGADIPEMAFLESATNTWAVRFALLHMLKKGLCLHPPRSLTLHIGFDDRSENCRGDGGLGMTMESLLPAPPLPEKWPEPIENSECPLLWQTLHGGTPSLSARMALAGRHLRTRIRYRLNCIKDSRMLQRVLGR